MAIEFKQIVARLDRLESLPASVQRILDEATRRRSNAKSIARIIEDDPPLSARVLRVANSGFHARRGTRVDDVTRAVARLGIKEVRNLAAASALGRFVNGKKGESLDLRSLYLSSLATGMVMELVAPRARGLPEVVAAQGGSHSLFTAGLLHDVGLFAMQRFVPKELAMCFEIARQSCRSLAEVERDQLDFAHTDVGAALLMRWRLPSLEVEACRWHHDPAKAPDIFRPLAQAMHAAELIVSDLGLSPAHRVLVPFSDDEALAGIGISIEKLADLRKEAEPALDRVRTLAEALA